MTDATKLPPLPEPDGYVAMTPRGSVIVPPQDFAKLLLAEAEALRIGAEEQLRADRDAMCEAVTSHIAQMNSEIEALRKRAEDAERAMAWQPIETAPKDRTEILAWREDCGQFIASYTSADSFPLTQDELDRAEEEWLFSENWFTQWPQALRLEGSEVPTHWKPLGPGPIDAAIKGSAA